MSRLVAQHIAFSPSTWDLTGDAAIATTTLSLTDPVDSLTMADSRWSVSPVWDAGTDAYIMAPSTTYRAQAAHVPFSVTDCALVFWMKALANFAVNAGVVVSMREAADAEYPSNGPKITASLLGNGASAKRWELANSTDVVVLKDVAASEFAVFRKVRVMARSAALGVSTTLRCSRYLAMDLTDAGGMSIAITDTNANRIAIGGAPGAYADPYVALKRTGTATLKTASAVALDSAFVSFDSLRIAYDATHDANAEQIERVTMRVKSYNPTTATWSAWAAVPRSGSLTGVTGYANGKLQVEVTLDNNADIEAVYESWPSVTDLVLAYYSYAPTFTTGDDMKTVMQNLKAAIDADVTVAAFTAWSGAQYLFEGQAQPDLFQGCGVLIVPNDSPESTTGRGQMVAGKPVRPKWYTHGIRLDVWMRPDGTMNDIYMATGGLLDLARAVRLALGTDPTLGGTVIETRVNSTKIDALTRWKDETRDEVPIVSIDIVVQTDFFEGN